MKKIPPILLFLPNKLEYATNTRIDYELILSLESQKNKFFLSKVCNLSDFNHTISEDPILLYYTSSNVNQLDY